MIWTLHLAFNGFSGPLPKSFSVLGVIIRTHHSPLHIQQPFRSSAWILFGFFDTVPVAKQAAEQLQSEQVYIRFAQLTEVWLHGNSFLGPFYQILVWEITRLEEFRSIRRGYHQQQNNCLKSRIQVLALFYTVYLNSPVITSTCCWCTFCHHNTKY